MTSQKGLSGGGIGKSVTLVIVLAMLAACEPLSLRKAGGEDEEGEISTAPLTGENGTVRIVERDVEAPEVFHKKAPGLWDGRPSLGGVWVAHPEADEPERVIIRNEENGKFVIGALFRRERDMPGPAFQISSDAAAALGVLPGKPVPLTVTALRRKEVPLAPPANGKTERKGKGKDEPLATAAAAIADAEKGAASRDGRPPRRPEASGTRRATASAPEATPSGGKAASKAKAQPARPGLAKPYVQVGIFSIEANARRTARLLEAEGIVPIIKEQTSRGRRFWRVLVGPAGDADELKVLLQKVRKAGFLDAYPVSR